MLAKYPFKANFSPLFFFQRNNNFFREASHRVDVLSSSSTKTLSSSQPNIKPCRASLPNLWCQYAYNAELARFSTELIVLHCGWRFGLSINRNLKKLDNVLMELIDHAPHLDNLGDRHARQSNGAQCIVLELSRSSNWTTIPICH